MPNRRRSKRADLRTAVALICVLSSAAALRAQVPPGLDKGHRILLERGFQIQATAVDFPEQINWSTFDGAGWNAVDFSSNFYGPSNYLGPAPGDRLWTAWYHDYSHTSFSSVEAPYASQCVAIQLDDEQDLNNVTVRTNVANWFAAARANYPDTILHINQIPFAASDAAYRDFMVNSQPDMLMIDSYRFVVNNSEGTWHLFSDMQRHRRYGLSGHDGSGAHPIPYGIYPQAIKSDFWRVPSESELRVNHFAAWAMGYKLTRDFTYNTYFDYAQGIFFNAGYQQANPTPSYYQVKEINRQGANLGPTLVRLLSTDVHFVNGQHKDAGDNVVTNPNPIDIPNWSQGAGGPYLRGFAVSNVGTKNDALPGDVLLSWFKPLDESFDGDGYVNETYFAVTNALVDPTGSATDCRQQVTLNFDLLSSGVSTLQRLRRDDGTVEVLPLTPIAGGQYSVTLTLDGGTADVLKFNDGAPFIGVPGAGFMYWDADANAAGNDSSNGAGIGGSESWDPAGAKWYTAGGSADAALSAAANAVFWGTAGNVKLASPATVNALTFKSSGYTITGSDLNLTSGFVTVDAGVSASIDSVLNGSAGLVKAGAGTLNLTAAAGNTYSGVTTINGGILGIASSTFSAEPAAPSINIAINNGSTLRFNTNGVTLSANRNVRLGTGGGVIDSNGNNASIAGVISGTTLTKAGTGTLTLSGTNTYTGGTTVTGGALLVSADANLGAAPVSLATNLTLNGGTLKWGGHFDIANTRGIQLGAAGGTFDTNGFGNVVGYNANAGGFTGPGDLTKIGAGTFFSSVTSGGANTMWKGRLILKEGVWRINASDGLPYNVPAADGLKADQVTFDGGTLQLAITRSITNALRGMTVAAGGGTIDTPGVDLTWAGPLAGVNTTATLNKTGSGILRFTGVGATPCTYNGNVNVKAGTLRLDNGNTMGDLASINLANASGATLNVTGNETIGSLSGGGTAGGNVTLSVITLTAGGNGNSTTFAGTISGAGGIAKTGAGTMTLTGTNTYTGTTTVHAGTLEAKRLHPNSAVTINAGKLKVLESTPTLPGHPAGDDAFVSRPTSLTIANNGAPLGSRVYNGTLDLTNNDLILDYSGASPIASIEDMVRSGYNVTGNWLGNGISSSVAALDGNYAIAIADNALLPAPFGTAQGGPLFAGVNVDLTTILVKFTHRADLNLDGVITPDDAAVFGGNYDENQPAVWATGDMDYNGFFTPNDAAIFGGFYDEALTSLPEPACVPLLALALTLKRRRI